MADWFWARWKNGLPASFLPLFSNESSSSHPTKISWEQFQEILKNQPLQAQKKVQKMLEKHKVELSQRPSDQKVIDLALAILRTVHVDDLLPEPGLFSLKEAAAKIKALRSSDPFLDSIKEDSRVANLCQIVLQDSLSRELEKIQFIEELFQGKNSFAYWEYLTKQVASRDLEEGTVLPAEGGEDFYYIYRKIVQKGLIAYGLKALCKDSPLPPVLIFRPTQIALRAENMAETFMDNLSREGVGYQGFKSASRQLEELMKDADFRREEEKIILAGYSLAGAYAQRFLAYKEHWKCVSAAFVFNAPAIDAKTAQSFAAKINSSPPELELEEKLSLFFFRTEGDFADQVGEMHLGHGVREEAPIDCRLFRLVPKDPSDPGVMRHLACYFENGAHVEEINLKPSCNHVFLQNIQGGERGRFKEDLRKWAGFFLRPFYQSFLFFCSLGRYYFLARDKV